jgi:hypothetical protein
VRIYVPSTLPRLAGDLRAGQIGPVTAYAVTPALREAYASGDTEELEYVALLAAARASLGMLAADPHAPPRRVVLAADVPEVAVTTAEHPAAVTVPGPIPIAKLASAHVDDAEAAPDITKAVIALPAAAAGDADAEFDVGQADGHELAWYATQELPHLLDQV